MAKKRMLAGPRRPEKRYVEDFLDFAHRLERMKRPTKEMADEENPYEDEND